MKQSTFKITLSHSPRMSAAALKEFIASSMTNAGGRYDPDDDEFDTEFVSVTSTKTNRRITNAETQE